MAGFSLGGGSRGGGGGEEGGIPPETFFQLYGSGGGSANTGGNTGTTRNEEITSYARGFELWQQHQQQIQRHQHQQLYPSDGLLTFSDEALHLTGGSGGRGGGSEALGIRMRGPGGSGSGGISCQDCGNQAKKDCAHMRCRTCCKSRAFQCPTHVKSTWIPASKRRERQHQLEAAAALQQQQQQRQQQQQQQQQSQQPPLRIGGPSGGGSEPLKRQREITTRHPTTITTTSSGGGGMDALSFPAEVSSPAVFRCVRVSPLDYAEDEYAYQTAVSIGGHVFKGILYDQGPESQYPTTPRALTQHAGESSSSSAAAAALTTAATIATTLGTALSSGGTAASTAGLLDPSSLYPTPLSAFMAGTQFFAHHSTRPQ